MSSTSERKRTADREEDAKSEATALEIGRVTHSLRVCLGLVLCWSLRIHSLQVIKEADIAKIVGELTEEQRSVKEARGNACTGWGEESTAVQSQRARR